MNVLNLTPFCGNKTCIVSGFPVVSNTHDGWHAKPIVQWSNKIQLFEDPCLKQLWWSPPSWKPTNEWDPVPLKEGARKLSRAYKGKFQSECDVFRDNKLSGQFHSQSEHQRIRELAWELAMQNGIFPVKSARLTRLWEVCRLSKHSGTGIFHVIEWLFHLNFSMTFKPLNFITDLHTYQIYFQLILYLDFTAYQMPLVWEVFSVPSITGLQVEMQDYVVYQLLTVRS